MAFADLDDDMRVAEGMLKYVIKYVLEHAPEEMNFFNNFVDKCLLDRLNNVLNSEFGRITYTGQVHYAALKAKSETCMTGGTVFTKIQVKAVIFFLKSQLIQRRSRHST